MSKNGFLYLPAAARFLAAGAEADGAAPVEKATSDMSFKERMAQRAKRFGIKPTEKAKKEMRGERFGTGKKDSPKKGKGQQGKGGGGGKNAPKKGQQQQKQVEHN